VIESQPAIARVASRKPGTAFAVSARAALTAFHCVELKTAKRPAIDRAKRMSVIQRVELRFKPTSAVIDDDVLYAKVVAGDSRQDWALLELEERLPARWRTFSIRPRRLVAGEALEIRGFPGLVQEQIRSPTLDHVTVMCDAVREETEVVDLSSPKMGAGLDIRGMSGGPVLTRVGEEAVAIITSRMLDADAEQTGNSVYAFEIDRFVDSVELPLPETSDGELARTEHELAEEARSGVVSAAARLGALRQAQGDIRTAEPLLRQAAAGGDAPSAYAVGMLIDPGGDLVDSDPLRAGEALAWFRKAATGGDLYGTTTMGIRLRQHRRDDAAMPWLEEAVSRGTGDAMAAHTLARIYSDSAYRVSSIRVVA
jgi:Trypsin-like peptidase domain